MAAIISTTCSRTFGLILFFNEMVRLIWGPAGLNLPLPAWLNTDFEIFPGVYYPTYRLLIIVVALAGRACCSTSWSCARASAC